MLIRRVMSFKGWTRADGTRRATAPKSWPFGTVRPPLTAPEPEKTFVARRIPRKVKP